jgi:hypothetical protein
VSVPDPGRNGDREPGGALSIVEGTLIRLHVSRLPGRDREMQEAIRAAERSLAPAGEPTPDPGAEMAEHTPLVLAAYRELGV